MSDNDINIIRPKKNQRYTHDFVFIKFVWAIKIWASIYIILFSRFFIIISVRSHDELRNHLTNFHVFLNVSFAGVPKIGQIGGGHDWKETLTKQCRSTCIYIIILMSNYHISLQTCRYFIKMTMFQAVEIKGG